MPATGSAAVLAVQLLTFLQGPLVAIGEPAAPRQPLPSIEAPGTPSGESWLVVGSPPPSEQQPAADAQ